MQVLVTGGTGFIGSHLVEALLAHGHEVRCLVRDTRRLGWISRLPSETIAQGGLDDPPALLAAMRGVDQVYHVAGLTRACAAQEFFRVNDEGTRNLVHACLDTPSGPCRLIHLSSLAAVGPTALATACAEDAPPRPVSAYGSSKLRAEEAVLAARDRLHVTVLRPPVVYGPRDLGLLEVARWVARGLLPMPAGPARTLSFYYVQDLVRALLTAGEAETPSGEIFHVAGAGSFTWEQAGNALGDALGTHAKPVRIPVPILLGLATGADGWAWLAGHPRYFSRGKVREAAGHWLCDTSKARRELGVVPSVAFSQGLAVTVKWYREAGWLQ